jgi:ribonuclease H2 subunit C
MLIRLGVVVGGSEAAKNTDDETKAQRREIKDVHTKGREDEDEGDEAGVLEELAEFENIVVWGHESLPESDDIYVRGVEEWITFSEAMHSY